MGDNANDTEDDVKKLKRQLMGFDELNILKSPDDGEDGKKDISYDLGIDLPSYDFLAGFSDEYREKIDEIKSAMGSFVEDMQVYADILMQILALSFLSGAVQKLISLVSAIKKLYIAMGTYSKAKKGVLSVIAVLAEFVAYKEVFKDVGNGSKSVGKALLELVPITAVVGTALYAMLGSWGLLLAAITGVVGAVVGYSKGQQELYYELAKTEYYENQGVAIGEVRDALKDYFDSMDFDRQQQWIDKINASEEAYKDADEAYDLLWSKLSTREVLDSSDIESLAEAFEALAKAANNVNNAKIDSIISGINTSITNNLTPQLNDKLKELREELVKINIELGIKVDSAVSDYTDLMAEVQANGGVMTEEQKKKAAELKSQIESATIGGNELANTHALNRDLYKGKAINAGENATKIIKNVEALIADQTAYEEAINVKYGKDRASLEDLVNKGYLDESYLGVYEEIYKKELELIEEEYQKVLSAIVAHYGVNALDYDYYHQDPDWVGTVGSYGADAADAIASLFGGSVKKNGMTGAEWRANRTSSEEQRDLLEELYRLTGIKWYGDGGFPDVGQMFIARERGPEMVGRIGNRTAVANNDQITTGIASAVYNAMMAAHEDSEGGGGTNARIYVQIGNETVGEAAVRFINGQIVQTGVSPILT
jgi:hypothetical protein